MNFSLPFFFPCAKLWKLALVCRRAAASVEKRVFRWEIKPRLFRRWQTAPSIAVRQCCCAPAFTRSQHGVEFRGAWLGCLAPCETKLFPVDQLGQTTYGGVLLKMARIAGVDLPREKRVEIGLTYIYGIGLTTSQKMLAEVGVNPDTRVKDLSETEISKLREYIEHNLKVEGDLRREVSLNIKRLIEIGCYRGVRHRHGLPVRGQNTKQNARTRKGPKKTIAGKKKATK